MRLLSHLYSLISEPSIEEMESLRGYTQGALSFLNSDGLIPQLVLTIIIVLVVHTIIMLVESLVQGIRQYNRLSTTLVPNTIMQQNTIIQDPKDSSTYVFPSKNEVNGVEFSYSFHVYIDPKAYVSKASSTEFYSIWYKGAESTLAKPLTVMAPGVFLRADENTMRIYMNILPDSSNSLESNYVEIPNIPVGKWFHMVIVQKGQNMDTYINGNLAVRRQFSNIPILNYGHVYVLPNQATKIRIDGTSTAEVKKPMEGMVSRLNYYAYALSYAQIDSLYREGPSSKIESTSYDQTPPYFHDNWWVTRFKPASSHYGL